MILDIVSTSNNCEELGKLIAPESNSAVASRKYLMIFSTFLSRFLGNESMFFSFFLPSLSTAGHTTIC